MAEPLDESLDESLAESMDEPLDESLVAAQLHSPNHLRVHGTLAPLVSLPCGCGYLLPWGGAEDVRGEEIDETAGILPRWLPRGDGAGESSRWAVVLQPHCIDRNQLIDASQPADWAVVLQPHCIDRISSCCSI